MLKIENKILVQNNKKPIVYDLYFKKNNLPKPVVVFCHGYKGFKDWGAWHLVANAFANAGFFFLKFNFSHNGGTKEQPIDFPDLEAFAQNNFSIELEDIDRVLDFISEKNKFYKEIDTQNISLIGHSRGGGIVLIKAEENPKIKKVISWAGVSDYKVRFKENTEQFKQWKEMGVFYVENSRTKQKMPHYFQFYKNFIENEKRLTIRRAVKQIHIPQLIVHGEEDTTVTIAEAEVLKKWNENAKLVMFPKANHVFGATHPWKSKKLPKDLQKVVRVSIDFLKNN